MAITPIDNTRNASLIHPVQRVQRAQAAALRFKLPGTDQASTSAQRRKPKPGRTVTIHEDGWVREYGLLPDGTRILLSEEAEHGAHPFPLPHNPAPRIVEVNLEEEAHDPECSMKASGRKLKSLLRDGK